MIFGVYVDWLGYNQAVTRFIFLNVAVDWDTTLEDHGLPDGGRINMVLFGWIFSVADLGFIDWCGEPPSQGRRTFR